MICVCSVQHRREGCHERPGGVIRGQPGGDCGRRTGRSGVRPAAAAHGPGEAAAGWTSPSPKASSSQARTTIICAQGALSPPLPELLGERVDVARAACLTGRSAATSCTARTLRLSWTTGTNPRWRCAASSSTTTCWKSRGARTDRHAARAVDSISTPTGRSSTRRVRRWRRTSWWARSGWMTGRAPSLRGPWATARRRPWPAL